jgi:DNA-binding LytR/AlgR family response regulator
MPTTLRAIIADDEAPLRRALKTQLGRVWPALSICAEAENGIEALEQITTLRPDIAFLDIRMPGMSGMDVAREVAAFCRIVFITAYDQFAVEAFENEAVDYLL